MKIQFFLILIFAMFYACENPASSEQTTSNWLIDSLTQEGYQYKAQKTFPQGIKPNLLNGYTNRMNGIYHSKELPLKSLQITGLKFEKQEETWTKQVHFYKFEFGDKQEEKAFENFQQLIQNYQTHSKNQIQFFKRNAVWYLKFIPMP